MDIMTDPLANISAWNVLHRGEQILGEKSSGNYTLRHTYTLLKKGESASAGVDVQSLFQSSISELIEDVNRDPNTYPRMYQHFGRRNWSELEISVDDIFENGSKANVEKSLSIVWPEGSRIQLLKEETISRLPADCATVDFNSANVIINAPARLHNLMGDESQAGRFSFPTYHAKQDLCQFSGRVASALLRTAFPESGTVTMKPDSVEYPANSGKFRDAITIVARDCEVPSERRQEVLGAFSFGVRVGSNRNVSEIVRYVKDDPVATASRKCDFVAHIILTEPDTDVKGEQKKKENEGEDLGLCQRIMNFISSIFHFITCGIFFLTD